MCGRRKPEVVAEPVLAAPGLVKPAILCLQSVVELWHAQCGVLRVAKVCHHVIPVERAIAWWALKHAGACQETLVLAESMQANEREQTLKPI